VTAPRESGIESQSDINNGTNSPMADKSDADHKHGSMDIRVQEKTFDGFVRMTTWSVWIIIAVLIFMALAGA